MSTNRNENESNLHDHKAIAARGLGGRRNGTVASRRLG